MKWNKLGNIFDVKDFSTDYDYSAVPFVKNINSDVFEVFFSSRDNENRSQLMSFNFNINKLEVESFNNNILLKSGELGTFDDSGVMGTDYLSVNGKEWIYYIGWNLGVTVPFRNSLGLAELSSDNEWTKLYPGPILDRNKHEPHFNASSCIIYDEGIYKIWYLSCVKWVKFGDETRHYYHIKYATSENGIDWARDGSIAIDFESNYEYAISVPRVVKINNKYHMWFSSRATKEKSTYEIRYACSDDGITWRRAIDPVLTSSNEGWDSDMVCYPCVFQHNDKLYMLYNGNFYGQSGIGLAEMELEEIDY